MIDGVVSTKQKVRYAETDQMGIVYNGVYPIWFEIGRTEYMEARGLPYREIESRGILLPVSDISYRLIAPARYAEVITIDTWLARLESRRVSFGYRIHRDDTVLATGTARLISLNRDFRPIRLPEWVASVMGPVLGDAPRLA